MIWYEMLFLVVLGFGLGFSVAGLYFSHLDSIYSRRYLDWLMQNHARQQAFLDSLFHGMPEVQVKDEEDRAMRDKYATATDALLKEERNEYHD